MEGTNFDALSHPCYDKPARQFIVLYHIVTYSYHIVTCKYARTYAHIDINSDYLHIALTGIQLF